MINWHTIKHSNCICCLSLYDNSQYDTAYNICHICINRSELIHFHYSYEQFIEIVRNCLRDYMLGKSIDYDYYAICNILIKYRLNASIINKKILKQNVHVLSSGKYNDVVRKKCLFQILKCNLFDSLNSKMLSSIMSGMEYTW